MENKPSQYGLGGEFTFENPNRVKVSTAGRSEIIKSLTIIPIIPSEKQLKDIDSRIEKEIPKLRIVKKGQVILVTSQNHNFTRVFLEQDAILIGRHQKEYPKKINYFLYTPTIVKSVKYGNTWIAKQGLVDTFKKHRKISNRQKPEVKSRLKKIYVARLNQCL